MHSELHGNVVHHGVELLLHFPILFLLAIPKSVLILKEFLYTSVCKSGAESLDMGSPSYSSACRIVATTMEECSTLPSVLVVYSLVALPRCNNLCRGTELHCLWLRRCS